MPARSCAHRDGTRRARPAAGIRPAAANHGHRSRGALAVSRALSVVALLLAAASRLPAQSANDLLQQGVRAYQRLEYDAAVALLRESLLRRQPMALADSERARALSYLAATELFQQQRDSAAAAFRDLVRLDPRYRPDELIFPPQVTNLYEEVRRSTKVLSVQVPPVTELHARIEWFTARLVTTSVQS